MLGTMAAVGTMKWVACLLLLSQLVVSLRVVRIVAKRGQVRDKCIQIRHAYVLLIAQHN